MEKILMIANDYYLVFLIIGIILLLSLIGYISYQFHQRSLKIIENKKDTPDEETQKESTINEDENPTFAFEEK